MEGAGAQIVQQIEGLLAQLAEQEPEPEIQRAIQGIQTQLEPLQQIVGKDDEQDMQSGLANPGGAGGMPPPPGGAPPPSGVAGLEAGGGPGMEPGEEGGAGGESHHEGGGLEIHIKPASKTFAGARKAAMATHSEKGHFNPRGAKGEEQKSQRTKNRAKA